MNQAQEPPEERQQGTAPEPTVAEIPTAEMLFQKEKISLAITLLPLEGENTAPGEREVLLGIRNGNDPPLFSRCRWEELENLPPVLTALLAELKELLPGREAERRATKASPTTTPRLPTSHQTKSTSTTPVGKSVGTSSADSKQTTTAPSQPESSAADGEAATGQVRGTQTPPQEGEQLTLF